MLMAVVLSSDLCSLRAQTNDASIPPKLSAADQEKRTEEKHTKPIRAQLAVRINSVKICAHINILVGSQQ
jgi:hypothetical protein